MAISKVNEMLLQMKKKIGKENRIVLVYNFNT